MSSIHYPRTYTNMAIIRSLAVGKARKSAGNITFRTVRGRTIVSEKVGERAVTRGDGLSIYESRFKLISMFIGMHRKDINVSFDKTKYGSQGNYFYKVNKAGLEAAVQPLIGTAESATPSQVNDAVTTYVTANPEAIYRVKRTGYASTFMTKAWSSADNPVKPTGVTINGAVGVKNSAFVANMGVLVPSGEKKSIAITDTGTSFAGIGENDIKAYDDKGAAQSDSVSIENVVAEGDTLSFDCSSTSDPDVGITGPIITAFAINGYFYQATGAIQDNQSGGDGNLDDNPMG